MALSNAERQKRFRERSKAAAENGGDGELKGLLVGTYLASGRAMLTRHADVEAARASLDEFEAAVTPTVLDLMEMVEVAGQRAALKIFERRARAYMAALRSRVPPEPPALSPRRRKRQATVT